MPSPNNTRSIWKYELFFNGDEEWTDVSSIVDSRQTEIERNGCSRDLKSSIDVFKCTLNHNNGTKRVLHNYIVARLLTSKTANEQVMFRCTKIADDSYVFYGRIDLGNISQVNKKNPGPLTIECEDRTYLLEKDMEDSFEYPSVIGETPYYVFNSSDTGNSIVHRLALAAGLTLGEIDNEGSDQILLQIQHIAYDNQSPKTFRQFLDDLLFECGAVFTWTREGKLQIRSLIVQPGTVADHDLGGLYLNADGVKTNTGDHQNDGVKLTWSNLSAMRAVVYSANISLNRGDDGEIIGEEIEPQSYYPDTGDIEDVWQEFSAQWLDREYFTKKSRLKNKDLSLITVQNHELEAVRDSDIILVPDPIYEALRARILFFNKNTEDKKYLKTFRIIGDCLYRSKINEYTVPAVSATPEEYESEFVFNEEHASLLANHLRLFNTFGDITHTWGIRGYVDLFDIYTVAPTNSAISTLAKVISVKETLIGDGIVNSSVTAVGISIFNSETPRKRSVQNGSISTIEGPAGASGAVPIVQYCIGTYDEPLPLGESTVGDDTGSVGDETGLLGETGWSYTRPTPALGEYVWMRVGTYTPPERWPSEWQETRLTGSDARGIKLSATALTIPVSSRGVPRGDDINLVADLQNIALPEGGLTWTISPVGAVTLINTDPANPQQKIIDISTISNDIQSFFIEVTCAFKGVTYSDRLGFEKVSDGLPAPIYMGVVEVLPTAYGDEPLVEGDYCLYMPKDGLGEYDESNPLFGHVVRYDGEMWISTTDSQSMGGAAKDAYQIARDTGKFIYAAAIIADIVLARNLQAGQGTGAAGSGFRFRAMDDDYSLEASPKVPRFDAYADNVKLFEIVPSGDDYGDVTLGDYENNRGMKYDHSEHEFDVRGSIRVSDGVKNTFKALSKSDGDSNAGDVEIGDYAAGKGAKYFADTGEFKAKFSEIRNVLPYTYMDSLDANHPFEIDFFIPEETVNIVSIKLNARGLAYRAYSYALGVNEGYFNNRNTGSTTPSMGLTFDSFGSTGAAGGHSHSYDKASGTGYNEGSHAHSLTVPFFENASTSSADGHQHGYVIPTGVSSGGAHSHSISHSGATTGSVSNHSHSVSIANGVTGGAHTHTYSIDHTHNIVFGIYEGTIPASVNLYCDNGSGYGSAISLGSAALLAENLNLTAQFSGTGWKKIKFTSSRLGRITALLMVNVDITA